jgi:phosphatidylglycerophosphatase A
VAAHKIAPPKLTSLQDYIATFGGVGLLPIMPGSYCSVLVALPALYLSLFTTVSSTSIMIGYGVAAVVFAIIGHWSIKHIQGVWGHDPSVVVIDEAVGMSLTLMFPAASAGLALWMTAVLLFRIFDVMKPWPMNVINDRTEAWAVIGDDAAAGLVAGIATQIVAAAIMTLGLSIQM